MTISEFGSYKAYVRYRVAHLPKKGRGEFLRLAKKLGVHSSMISHVFKGDAQLTIEQGLKVASHYNLNSLETDYFLCMLQHERAGNTQTQEYFRIQLEKQKERFQDLSKRLETKKVLDEKDRSTFYSHWYYLGIQILTSIKGFHNPSSIAQHLRLPTETVMEVLEFLVQTGLCVRDGEDYKVGITRTYVERDSPLVSRHHTNWRLRVLQQFPNIQKDELVFTCPTTISKHDFVIIREKIARLIEDFDRIITPSKDEEFACFNVDWVKIKS